MPYDLSWITDDDGNCLVCGHDLNINRYDHSDDCRWAA